VIVSLGILSVGLIVGLIRLGVHFTAFSWNNDQLSAMTKERDQLNATLMEMSNEISRLQSLSIILEKTCPDGWRRFSFSCYLLITETGAWNKARENCKSREGDLVVINDDDEQIFVRALIKTSAWIGLTEETEGSWKWVDGTPLSSELKKFWAPGQPDNSKGIEACAQIWDLNRKWNDDKCSALMTGICEK
uniref:C-type lectin domain-containing protein n=1 Tax=Poecilia formosa TaxID=48698 RepID=A0A096LZZ0_POEFO